MLVLRSGDGAEIFAGAEGAAALSRPIQRMVAGSLASVTKEGEVWLPNVEGAVLHALQYDGRPVAWRLSWVEMVVPYADPNHPHCFKNAFDLGEDGLGRNCHELDPDRCDCLPGAAAAFLDACIATADGGAAVRRRVVCVHEEDAGILWKHVDWRTGDAVARRGRSLPDSLPARTRHLDV